MERCRVFSVTGEELSPCRWARAKKLVKESKAEKFKLDGLQCIKMLEPNLKEKKMENKFEFPETLYQYVNAMNGYILEYKKDKQTKELDDGILYISTVYNSEVDDKEEDSRIINKDEIDIFVYGYEKPIEEIDKESEYLLEDTLVRISLQQAKNDEKFFKKQRLMELKQKTEELEKDLSEFPEELFKFHVPQHLEDDFIREFHFHCLTGKHGEKAIYLENPYEEDCDEEDWDNIEIHINEINNLDCVNEMEDMPYRLNKEDVVKDFEKYIEVMKSVLINYKKENEEESEEDFPEKLYYFDNEIDAIIVETKSEDDFGITNKKIQCKYFSNEKGKKEFYILRKEIISDTLPMSENKSIHRTTIRKAIEDSENYRKEKLLQLTSQIKKLESPPQII